MFRLKFKARLVVRNNLSLITIMDIIKIIININVYKNHILKTLVTISSSFILLQISNAMTELLCFKLFGESLQLISVTLSPICGHLISFSKRSFIISLNSDALVQGPRL